MGGGYSVYFQSGDYISFSYGNRTIRFKGLYSLKRIESVVEWDKGYLVVMVDYHHSVEAVEDYIDMIPILEHLYIDPEQFLQKIKQVEFQYA